MSVEIGYWNLRGLVGFVKLIAVYTGETVKWISYDINSRVENSREIFFSKIQIFIKMYCPSKFWLKIKILV